MNILDYPETFYEKDLENFFQLIFQRQRELAEKYQEIETKNGFHYPIDLVLNLNDRLDQNLLKNMAWRTVEELGESLEAYTDYLHSTSSNGIEQLLHAKEELADGLHFITEACILSGIQYTEFKFFIIIAHYNTPFEKDRRFFDQITEFIMKIGISMNCLKLKPWKNTHYQTDTMYYLDKLKRAYTTYIGLMLKIMTPLEILNFYFRKSQVNQFRQESNY